MFTATQGYCRICGRRWGHGGTPLSELRGSIETGFRMSAQ